MRIKEIMNHAIAVNHDIPIKEAAKIMTGKKIGSLIAMKGDKIAGILTDKDITKSASDMNKKISSVMTRVVDTIQENESLIEAVDIMKKRKIKHLPVVNEDGTLVGIVTATDLIEHSDDLEEDFWM